MAEYDQEPRPESFDEQFAWKQSVAPAADPTAAKGTEGREPRESSEAEGHDYGPVPTLISTSGETMEKFLKMGETGEQCMKPGSPIAGLGVMSGAMDVDEGLNEAQKGAQNPDSGTGAMQQIHGGLKAGVGVTEIIGGGAAMFGIEGTLAELGPVGMAAGAGLAVGDAIAPTVIDPFFEGPSYIDTLDTLRAKEATVQTEKDMQVQVARNRNCDSGLASADEQCERERQDYDAGAQSISK